MIAQWMTLQVIIITQIREWVVIESEEVELPRSMKKMQALLAESMLMECQERVRRGRREEKRLSKSIMNLLIKIIRWQRHMVGWLKVLLNAKYLKA
jgi:hypothetical protein